MSLGDSDGGGFQGCPGQDTGALRDLAGQRETERARKEQRIGFGPEGAREQPPGASREVCSCKAQPQGARGQPPGASGEACSCKRQTRAG